MCYFQQVRTGKIMCYNQYLMLMGRSLWRAAKQNPATIPVKGVELGCIIGGHIAEGQNNGIGIEHNLTLDVDTLKQTQLK